MKKEVAREKKSLKGIKNSKVKLVKPKLSVASRCHPTTKYALELIAGKYICCQAELQLAQKHIRDLERQGTKNFPYVFDESRANRFFRFFNVCVNPDTGEHYSILSHQQFDNGLLYGWVEKETGNRKYTKVYKQEAKAQAKTTSCAIKAMYALISDKIYLPSDGENSKNAYIVPNVEVHLMAVDSEQAKELREPIVTISKISEALSDKIDGRRTFIRGIENGGWIRVLSADLNNKQGGKPNVVIIDELSSHRDGKRASVVAGNLGKKGQKLLEIITTAGDNEMTNPAKIEYEYSKKVLSGELTNERYLPIIREVEDGDNIHDTNIWQKSHPMFRYLGQYKYADNLYNTVKELYDEAFGGDNPELKRQFLIFRMNQWQELSNDSYLNKSQINKLKSLAVSREEFDKLTFGRKKIVGFDFSERVDLTADADVYELDDGRIAIDAHGYMLKNFVIEREKGDRVQYREWAKQGWITLLDEQYVTMDNEVVAKDFLQRTKEKEQEIVEVRYDPFRAKGLIQDLVRGKYGVKFLEEKCLMVLQDPGNLFVATERLKNAIIKGKIVWNGNPLLLWCFMNCYTVTFTTGAVIDGIKVKKKDKDSKRRIDLVAAIITAMTGLDNLEDNNYSIQDALYCGNFSF